MSYLLPNDGPRSSRNHFVDPPGLRTRLYNTLPPALKAAIAKLQVRVSLITNAYTGMRRGSGGIGAIPRLLRLIFSLQTVLILIWAFTLWWGERMVFWDSLKACEWGKWEKWVCDMPGRDKGKVIQVD